MRSLPRDRKKYILNQNNLFKASTPQESSGVSHPTYAASYGPSSAAALLPKLMPQLTGDGGLMRRFSIVGWGSGISTVASQSVDINGNGEVQNITGSTKQSSGSADEQQPIQPQNTGILWNSWWTSSGGEKSSTPEKRGSKEYIDSARWYIDGLRIGKAPDMKLVKHLITLRVHLSTAKLSFIQDFVGSEKGLIALGTLLSGLVGKGGKRKNLSELEITILLEILKCLRVLLNTEVRL